MCQVVLLTLMRLELELELPEVFTACMVTCAQARKCIEEGDTGQEAVGPTFHYLSDSLLSGTAVQDHLLTLRLASQWALMTVKNGCRKGSMSGN